MAQRYRQYLFFLFDLSLSGPLSPFSLSLAYLYLLSSLDKSYENSDYLIISPKKWLSYVDFSMASLFFNILIYALFLSLPTSFTLVPFLFLLLHMDLQLFLLEPFSSSTNIQGYQVHWKNHAVFYHSIAGNFHSAVISSFIHEFFHRIYVF